MGLRPQHTACREDGRVVVKVGGIAAGVRVYFVCQYGRGSGSLFPMNDLHSNLRKSGTQGARLLLEPTSWRARRRTPAREGEP